MRVGRPPNTTIDIPARVDARACRASQALHVGRSVHLAPASASATRARRSSSPIRTLEGKRDRGPPELYLREAASPSLRGLCSS